jgi:aminopeptidase N
MKWWDDIFLNEGFAQYWQVLAMNASLPLQTNYIVSEIFNKALRFFLNYGAQSPALRRTRAKQRGIYRIFGAHSMAA